MVLISADKVFKKTIIYRYTVTWITAYEAELNTFDNKAVGSHESSK